MKIQKKAQMTAYIILASIIFIAGCQINKEVKLIGQFDVIFGDPLSSAQGQHAFYLTDEQGKKTEIKILPDTKFIGGQGILDIVGKKVKIIGIFDKKFGAVNASSIELIFSEASVAELVNNPSQHINKAVQLKGELKFVGEDYSIGNGKLVLEDNNYQIQVSTWAPMAVAQCPPDAKDCKALTMATYLNKQVKLHGVLKEFPKGEYINEKWTVVGTYYLFDVTNIALIQKT